MKNLTDEFIILGSKAFLEEHKTVFLFNEKLGKIRAIAKGARKINSKFIGHLETLNTIKATLYFGPKNIIIQEICTEKNNYQIFKNDLPKCFTALKIAEITHHLIYENQQIKDLPHLIRDVLEQLAKTDEYFIILIAYTIKLFDQLGICPDFRNHETDIAEKYLKFFNFIKTRELFQIPQIKLKSAESNYIRNFIQGMLEEETQKKWILMPVFKD